VQYAQGGYEASFGTYEIDESAHTFTYHVDGALVRGGVAIFILIQGGLGPRKVLLPLNLLALRGGILQKFSHGL